MTKDDFELKEDGRRQTIRYFSQESGLPPVDTSRSKCGRAKAIIPSSKHAEVLILLQDRQARGPVERDFRNCDIHIVLPTS